MLATLACYPISTRPRHLRNALSMSVDVPDASGWTHEHRVVPIADWSMLMVHQLGHAFGLPDSTSTDGTCMSGSFYSFPNLTFTQTQNDSRLNGRWGSGVFLF